jgi:hypothetical protein
MLMADEILFRNKFLRAIFRWLRNIFFVLGILNW